MVKLTIIGVCLAASLLGCASATAPASEYARKACAYQPPKPGTDIPDVHEDDVVVARRYEDAAGWAARAARLDHQWDELNAAYSTLADAWSLVAALPETRPVGGFTQEDQPKVDRLTKMLPKITEAEATIRTECRKTE